MSSITLSIVLVGYGSPAPPYYPQGRMAISTLLYNPQASSMLALIHVTTNSVSGIENSALTPYAPVECRAWLHRINESLCHLEKRPAGFGKVGTERRSSRQMPRAFLIQILHSKGGQLPLFLFLFPHPVASTICYLPHPFFLSLSYYLSLYLQ